MAVVIKDCAYVMVSVPDFVRYGSKPMRDLQENTELLPDIRCALRTFEQVTAYGPNQVFIGNMRPDDLHALKQPWYSNPVKAARQGPFGEILPEEEFYGWLKIADPFDSVSLVQSFVDRIRDAVARHPFINAEDAKMLGAGISARQNQKILDEDFALPLYWRGEVIGSLKRAHDNDDALKAEILMENLVAKASGALVMRHLMKRAGLAPEDVDFILECSETAIGDRYNRGGGSMAKAVGEMCRCQNATGHDVRAFCASPLHAIVDAAALVEAGIYRNVVVVGGGCQAKIGRASCRERVLTGV